MVLHNPNNWHWVNKDVTSWAKEYLENDLVGIKAEKDGASAEISKLLSQEGDCEVAQRKGKVITIFDLKLQLEYTGENLSWIPFLSPNPRQSNKTVNTQARTRTARMSAAQSPSQKSPTTPRKTSTSYVLPSDLPPSPTRLSLSHTHHSST